MDVGKKVLFVCSHNSARSQIAEAFVRTFAGDAFEVHSAGLEAKGIDPLTIAVMSERGIDIAGQRSKAMQEFMGKARFDYVISVCDRGEKACPVFPGMGAREYWPLEDPAGAEASQEERLARFREVRDQIEARIRQWLAERRPRASKAVVS